jgi:hypothetical protein
MEALQDRLPQGTIDRDKRVNGRHEEHKFDLAVSNGQSLHVVEAFSFDTPERDDLRTEYVFAWAITDVKRAQPKLPITAVTIGNHQQELLTVTVIMKFCRSAPAVVHVST